MKIAIISIYPFPFGMASTNRVNAICQGLIESGDEPTVIMPFPPETHDSKTDLPDSGVHNGVKYIHLSGRKRNKNKLIRALGLKSGIRYHLGVVRTKRWLAENPQDVVIVYNDECRHLEDFGKIIHNSGAKAVFIFDEYPVPIREKGENKLPDDKKEWFDRILPCYDGYISINKILSDFYNAIVVKPTLEFSMVVDTKRFLGCCSSRKDWLTYMGQILWDKDNILNIIDAFNLIKDDFPAMTFHIFGKGDQHSIIKIKNRITAYGLNDRVIIEGFAEDEKVPEIMMTSKIMVSSQPNNKRVEGVLSTKLAEYIASGTPTVMCDVGANRDYVTDEDCFFVTPDNPDEYALILRRILNDYPQALAIARHGVESINQKYSMTIQGKKLSDFLKEL